MEFKPNKTEELLALLKNTQPQSVASPLSAFDLMEIQSKQLSKDPVIANLQKLGGGIKSLLEPETPLDYLGMAVPSAKVAAKAKKIASGIYEYKGHIIEDMGGYWGWGKLPKKAKHWSEANYEDADSSLKNAKKSIDSIIEKNLDQVVK